MITYWKDEDGRKYMSSDLSFLIASNPGKTLTRIPLEEFYKSSKEVKKMKIKVFYVRFNDFYLTDTHPLLFLPFLYLGWLISIPFMIKIDYKKISKNET